MKLKVEIRRNSDGVIVQDVWDEPQVPHEFSAYIWEDGNYSCDCNRELFFTRARFEDDPEETECGDERFSVRLSDADTGEILYDELVPNMR